MTSGPFEERVWEDTHFMANGPGIVLVFFMPQGVWQVVLFVDLCDVPTALSILYYYLI